MLCRIALKMWTSSCAGEKFWALRGSWAQAVPSWPWHSLACGPSTGGELRVGGKPVKLRSVQDAQRLGIAYVPEDRLTEGLFMPQSIVRNVAITHLGAVSRRGGLLDKHRAARETDNWIQTLSIATDSREAAAQKLSGGNQQKGGVGQVAGHQARYPDS